MENTTPYVKIHNKLVKQKTIKKRLIINQIFLNEQYTYYYNA